MVLKTFYCGCKQCMPSSILEELTYAVELIDKTMLFKFQTAVSLGREQ